jgi:FtsP/CotA-like multicopper oxidase with cupredoxin domain
MAYMSEFKRTDHKFYDLNNPRARLRFLAVMGIIFALVLLNIPAVSAEAPAPVTNPDLAKAVVENKVMFMHNITTEQRMAAAKVAAERGLDLSIPAANGVVTNGRVTNAAQLTTPVPGGIPDYFGPYSNYANSQLPSDDGLGNVTPGTGIRKFVDSLPGLGPTGANNLGNYIPVAVKDTTTFPGSDYYELASVRYAQKVHSDINDTALWGFVQIETNVTSGSHYPLRYPNGAPILNATGGQVYAVDQPRYLGPTIVATKDVPVRVKFTNYLPNGTDGLSLIPVDETLMGAGVGPNGVDKYKQNRVTLHLHGGATPWISDGTTHQWTAPVNENTAYPKGLSVGYVPDMNGGSEPNGTLSFYWTNQQSARLMFYHDHAMGITHINVYEGIAAGYLVTDSVEAGLVANGSIPSEQIPLVIQDKSFVPDAAQMLRTDPTWNWGNTSTPWPHTGSLYFNHVYMPLQNPNDPTNTNAMGRWDYGPWFWPPFTGFLNQPMANPYYDPLGTTPWEPPTCPPMIGASATPESFMDTMMVNGAIFPYVQVGPHAYRFRILNAANDRTLNLGLYFAGSNGQMWNGINLLNGSAGEVNMTAAIPGQLGQPADWPTDARVGGVPWANMSGPSWIQIGTEGGFMPAPAVIPPRPVDFDLAHQYGGVMNVKNHSLMLMPAQRADVIVNFSGIPDGSKLILYSDAPAPTPGGDSRYDYYTGDPNQTLIGGAPTTFAGYAPNTRTIMQIQINASIAAPAMPWSMANLTAQLPAAYAQSQERPLVPESAYNAAFGAAYPNQYVNLVNTTVAFTPVNGPAVSIPLQPKAIIGDFEMDYGRLTALLGTEIRRTGQNIESRVPSGYNDPPTELLKDAVINATPIGSLADGTQIWRITNVDVDLHPVHWHMVNLQVINRVIWDGTVVPPEPDELGWRETINTPPLTDTIVALRPVTPNLPWELPNSIRPIDPTQAIGATNRFSNVDPTGGQAPVVNHLINFGEEFVWHCHILGHEENDFMHTMMVARPPQVAPAGVTATSNLGSATVSVSWTDTTVSETDWTIQRSLSQTGPFTDIAMISSTTGPQTGATVTYSDTTGASGTKYYYQVLATNFVGDRTQYALTAGYPNMAVNSTPSSVVNATANTGTPSSSINLEAGWNQVSTPKRLSAGNNSALIFSTVNTVGHSIWIYNASTQTWQSLIATDTVMPLNAYWVYSNRSTPVQLWFDTNPLLSPPSKSLAAGWNGIGFSDVTPATARDTLSSVGSQWSIALGWNATAQAFDPSMINGGTGAHSDTGLMLPTKGYWLYMNQPGTIASIGA